MAQPRRPAAPPPPATSPATSLPPGRSPRGSHIPAVPSASILLRRPRRQPRPPLRETALSAPKLFPTSAPLTVIFPALPTDPSTDSVKIPSEAPLRAPSTAPSLDQFASPPANAPIVLLASPPTAPLAIAWAGPPSLFSLPSPTNGMKRPRMGPRQQHRSCQEGFVQILLHSAWKEPEKGVHTDHQELGGRSTPHHPLSVVASCRRCCVRRRWHCA